jgi:prepilin-type N-terminal cleavage/methylation domain-containing protein
MKNPVNNKKGLTLVEMMVAMLVFTIIVGAVSVVFAPLMHTVFRSKEMSEVNALLDKLSIDIISDLADMNTDIVIPAGGLDLAVSSLEIRTSRVDVTYSIDAGGFLRKTDHTGVNVGIIDDSYYKNKTVGITVTRSESTFTATLTLFDRDGNPMAARPYTVRPLAL